jgi:hypothetical protein
MDPGKRIRLYRKTEEDGEKRERKRKRGDKE